MAVPIFRLRGVADDEAEDVRQLLDQYGFDYYETPAGNWGISMPALWLVNDDDKERATELITEYQHERFIKARNEYERLKQEGRQRTFMDIVREQPIKILLYLLGILLVLYLSTKPFLHLGQL